MASRSDGTSLEASLSGAASQVAPAPDAAPLLAPDGSFFDGPGFCARVRALAAPHWRDLPWRRTRDPYRIWLSEVMLQQTQVPRVEARWDDWLGRFPTVEALAAADDVDVLAKWQGMGYNRRALALHRAARAVVDLYGGEFPCDRAALLALPGVGPSTAAGIMAFAFDRSGAYVETNVRAVFIHELFGDVQDPVTDKQLLPFVEASCPADGCDVRGWYYALLDYGAHLKKTVPNPTRKAKAYTRQSRFEGSVRQKRAELVRILLAARESDLVLSTEQVEALLAQEELASGRPAPDAGVAAGLLEALAREGFCVKTSRGWSIGSNADMR